MKSALREQVVTAITNASTEIVDAIAVLLKIQHQPCQSPAGEDALTPNQSLTVDAGVRGMKEIGYRTLSANSTATLISRPGEIENKLRAAHLVGFLSGLRRRSQTADREIQPAEEQRCCWKTPSSDGHVDCAFPPALQEGNLWYCAYHDPKAAAERWKQRQDTTQRHHANQALELALLTALNRIVRLEEDPKLTEFARRSAMTKIARDAIKTAAAAQNGSPKVSSNVTQSQS